MKKYLIILLITSGLFAGCGDWLDILPKNEQVTADYWKTKEDVEAVLASGYYYMRECTPSMIQWGELRGASVFARNHTEMGKLQDFQLEATSSLVKWEPFYQVINMANSVIAYAPQVGGIDATYAEAAVRSHQTEAYFMRALMYFYLVRNYKEVPLVLDAYVDDKADYSIAKSTEDVIVAQIKEDLKTALETGAAKEFFESDRWNPTKGRATKWALMALMADVCLWSEDYDGAVTYANQLLEASSAYRPAFMSIPEQWFTIFNPGNSNESVFEINWDATTFGQTSKSPSTLYNFSSGGYYYFSELMSERLRDDYLLSVLQGNEVVRSRYGAYAPVGISDDEGASLQYLVWKYMGTETDDYSILRVNQDANFIIYRMSEVLLIKAEALIWKGRESWSAAVDIINQIRARAGVTLLDLVLDEEDEASMLGYVLHERDMELAAEGKRWYDLVRLGKSKNYTHRQLFVDAVVENNSTANDTWVRSVLNNSYAWYLPIPHSEIETNDLLVQNPYYATTQ